MNFSPIESQSVKRYLKYAAGSIILIFAVCTVGYFIYKNIIPIISPQKNVPQTQKGIDLSQAPVEFFGEKSLSERPLDFKGTLYLSLIKINGQDGLGIYAFNIEGTVGSRFTTIFADKISKDGDYYINISPSVSKDGKTLVFARKKMNDPALQIFTSDISGKNIHQITNTPDKYKREPVFSPSGEFIAYISHNTKSSDKDPDPGIPESWSTYLTDIKGNAIRVADGVNPIFSPDGKKLLVLQNDGLHAFDISTWTTPKHLGLVLGTVGGGASAMMKIGVSADGKMIAWPSVSKNNVVVSRINSWDNFSISPLLVIETKAYWSVFSPDGKYLAMLEWRKDDTGKEYPIIMGYDLSNGKSEKIVTLTSDDKSYLWFGAWK